jgi:hypothetical protein
MTTSPNIARPSLGASLPYAAFLACSWTWCIGMFLPVLLVRDFSVWGWIVFLVPNVIGASAMGSIPRSGQALEDLRTNHLPALKLFSLVTIAFHLFFNGWIIRRLLPDFGPSLTIALAILIYLIICRPNPRDLLLSIVVFAVSYLGMLLAGFSGALDTLPSRAPLATTPNLLSVAAVCCFGFLLCPYLDLTFHRVRQSAGPLLAPIAFVLGLFCFFSVILVFSLRYAPFLAPIINDPSALNHARTPAFILGLYFSLQSAFTVAVHARELIGTVAPANRGRTIMLAAAVFVVPVILGIVSQEPLRFFGLAGGEVFYRCFMGFYALYFPAYVYLCIIPRRTSFLTYAVAVILATPLFFAAFILNHMPLLFPALAIILLAKLLPRKKQITITNNK